MARLLFSLAFFNFLSFCLQKYDLFAILFDKMAKKCYNKMHSGNRALFKS